MKEKPEVQLDDYILEHFLLYHGLVGSTPENQRDYKDVRADVIEAVNHASSAEMSIALKVPPLWWEDRLGKIFDEVIRANRGGAVKCLLPEHLSEDPDPNKFPLTHLDWRVRSNAAIMLSKLGVLQAAAYMTRVLDDEGPDQRPAFCHIAYSMSRLQSDQTRQALIKHLDNDEPWFRVDAAGALAAWPLHAVAHPLMRAMQSDHDLMDYQAVAIARKHSAASLFESSDDEIVEGAAEMVCALLSALSGTFHAEPGLAEQLEACAEPLNIVTGVKPTPRRLNATILLNKWLSERNAITASGSPASAVYTLKEISSEPQKICILEILRQPAGQPQQESQLRHAIELAGTNDIGATSLLIELLRTEHRVLPVVVESLGKLNATEAAPEIIALLRKKLDLNARWTGVASKHPIAEQDEPAALLYWKSLQALGSMPCAQSLQFLSQAVNDIAPDKREQALLALEKVSRAIGGDEQGTANLTEILRDKLADPSAQVRAAALKAVGARTSTALLSDSMRLIHSPEASLQRQCIETLSQLANAGHRDEVVSATKAALNKELDGAKRDRLNRLLQAL